MPPVHYHEGKFPPQNLDWQKLLPLIGPATAAVARYDSDLSSIPNAQLLLAPLTSQEAVLSSRIEGTQATLEEVLEYEAGEEADSPEKRDDIQEILNYRRAMAHAVEALKKLPLSERVLRATHRILMEGVRGESKAPGEYRKLQNYIGRLGTDIDAARFIPPAPPRVPELMPVWERYLHQDAPDVLVQLAVAHAEFEAIHPFMDGNGRLGRLLIPLFLMEKGLLASPTFYLSAYLEARREAYYDRLLAVSRDGDWTGWCVFFLKAVERQAKANSGTARDILALYQEKKDWIVELTHSQHAIHALDWLFARPIFKSTDFINSSGIPAPSARRILNEAHEGGLLRRVRESRGRRAAVYALTEVLRIAAAREHPDDHT